MCVCMCASGCAGVCIFMYTLSNANPHVPKSLPHNTVRLSLCVLRLRPSQTKLTACPSSAAAHTCGARQDHWIYDRKIDRQIDR